MTECTESIGGGLWEQELAREAVGAEMGLLHGQWLQYLEDQVQSLEEELAMVPETTGKGLSTCSSLQGDQRPCEQPDALGCQ